LYLFLKGKLKKRGGKWAGGNGKKREKRIKKKKKEIGEEQAVIH
jgi:hypothetical protein